MSNQGQLVCQYLENVSREALGEYQRIIKRYVRHRQGVYALYRKGRLYYVGLAGNLRSRLSHHLKDRHCESWDRFSVYLTIGDKHLHELETLILRIVKPSGNKQQGKFVLAEDLRRHFARDVRKDQLAELKNVLGITKLGEVENGAKPNKPRPVLARYIQRPMVLKAYFKGKYLKARVRRDGSIRFRGKIYTSPSLAGAEACKRVSCNGWTFWQFERAPGDWIQLNELRQR